MKRVILIVLDSVGIGELPDAKDYGDEGSNTLVNTKKAVPSMNLKSLNKMGLSNIAGCGEVSDTDITEPTASFGRMAEASKGKDTTVGHWEIAGVLTEKLFPTYPNGFPEEVLKEFEEKTGRKVIGNCVASGTEIIDRLGKTHVETGDVILYTSADSVFQIASHEDVVPIEELHHICKVSREMLKGEHAVARVIARPFIGDEGNYKRTKNRKDFSIKPHKKTMLDFIKEAGQEVVAIGKIEDIFAGEGVTKTIHTSSNMDGVDKTIEHMKTTDKGLIFTNLVDFDMIYGHRNDAEGYANALLEFDKRVDEIAENLREDDILIITADHGCDPTTPSTDHSREYIPLIVYGNKIKQGVDLGTCETFADISATVMEYLSVDGEVIGNSFLEKIKI